MAAERVIGTPGHRAAHHFPEKRDDKGPLGREPRHSRGAHPCRRTRGGSRRPGCDGLDRGGRRRPCSEPTGAATRAGWASRAADELEGNRGDGARRRRPAGVARPGESCPDWPRDRGTLHRCRQSRRVFNPVGRQPQLRSCSYLPTGTPADKRVLLAASTVLTVARSRCWRGAQMPGLMAMPARLCR